MQARWKRNIDEKESGTPKILPPNTTPNSLLFLVLFARMIGPCGSRHQTIKSGSLLLFFHIYLFIFISYFSTYFSASRRRKKNLFMMTLLFFSYYLLVIVIFLFLWLLYPGLGQSSLDIWIILFSPSWQQDSCPTKLIWSRTDDFHVIEKYWNSSPLFRHQYSA